MKGSVLVGVLWCVVLLSLVVLSVLHTSRLDLVAGRYQTDRIQAHYLALAGVEKAKALLYQGLLDRNRAGVPFNREAFDAPDQFRDVHLGRGIYRVIRAPNEDEGGGGIIYGVNDEESRLNVNVADVSELTKIIGLTHDVAAAIVDWRDGDNTVTPGGAESPYYASLQPPYLPRNGPFPTLRELLMVRGIDRQLLFGEAPESAVGPSAAPGPIAAPPKPGPGGEPQTSEEAGWAAWMTVHSSSQNVDATGRERLNVQTADEAALTGVSGITTEIARAIVAYRQQSALRNLSDLLDVTQSAPDGGRLGRPGVGNGPPVIDERLLKQIADRITMEDRDEQDGPVNINSASVEVLLCLPGMNRSLAQAVVAHRRSNGFFTGIAGLLDVPGFNRNVARQLFPRVCVRSETFRIHGEGDVGGTRQNIEVVVRVRARSVITLDYREDDL